MTCGNFCNPRVVRNHLRVILFLCSLTFFGSTSLNAACRIFFAEHAPQWSAAYVSPTLGGISFELNEKNAAFSIQDRDGAYIRYWGAPPDPRAIATDTEAGGKDVLYSAETVQSNTQKIAESEFTSWLTQGQPAAVMTLDSDGNMVKVTITAARGDVRTFELTRRKDLEPPRL